MKLHQNTIFLLTCITFFAVGCSNNGAVKIDGITLDVWAERLDSGETDIKLDALDAISSIGSQGLKLKHKLTYVARYDNNNEVKYSAIKVMENLNLPIDEFADFIQLYDAPIIPVAQEGEILYGRGASNRGARQVDKSSVMDDINYLKELSNSSKYQADSGIRSIPTDPDEYDEFVDVKRSESIDDLIQMLNDPDVLHGLMKSGDELEKTFAFDRLSSIENLDPMIDQAVKKFSQSLDEEMSLDGKGLIKMLEQAEMP